MKLSGLRLHRWRLLRCALAGLVVFSILASYIYLSVRPSYALYDRLHRSEVESANRFLHDSANDQAKFVVFRQLQGAGFNNQAQEILLFHHLALTSNRTYVYQPLVWRPRGEKATVPLSAFLYGVTDSSVPFAGFEDACPPESISHIRLRTKGVTHAALWTRALALLQSPARCIVVDDWILNWSYLASSAIPAIWPSFSQYLSSQFAWSPRILEISNRTYHTLNLRPNHLDIPGDRYLAVHFRRGDFEDHCRILSERQTGFTTWAVLPELQSAILSPPLDTANGSSVMEHCYPSIERVIAAIKMQTERHPLTTAVHVLHDGAWDHPTVYYLTHRLGSELKAQSLGWVGSPIARVTHSGQVPLQWGEADWAVAVDLEIARRADGFIGNGYSSFSTQAIALRLGADSGKLTDISIY
ncbi:hypothetical protein BDV98DRAFT_647105 [Pterulicium gracile]|uniref:Uncharacterized protein n=1 Tax=Pterulicium gracile TaxID=1884261 RepID=A0A5C3QZZ4_9AGAR|nr:hypothetical protein BDV98DRAFT_647105 [Pterula gracilis]